MSVFHWGNVYYSDTYCGIIREDTGGRYVFAYDDGYSGPPIAHAMPVRPEPYISQQGLHPFFDNLVAEGWLAAAQARLLGKRQPSRFQLLLAFGHDCAGAVSIVDPHPQPISAALIAPGDQHTLAALKTRASLSGIQPKLAMVTDGANYRPAAGNELSTHIAKLPSPRHTDLIDNEYLTTLAVGALLPKDHIVQPTICELPGIGRALLIPRFDRAAGQRIHFEELNSLLGRSSDAKYDADHGDIAAFLTANPSADPIAAYRILTRILAAFITGNTDMHLKNFSMFHSSRGLTPTPNYDQVSAVLYGYADVALGVLGAPQRLVDLKARHIVGIAKQFQLEHALPDIVQQLERRLNAAISAVQRADTDCSNLKSKLANMMEARWNGTFKLIGQQSSKKQSADAKTNA